MRLLIKLISGSVLYVALSLNWHTIIEGGTAACAVALQLANLKPTRQPGYFADWVRLASMYRPDGRDR